MKWVKPPLNNTLSAEEALKVMKEGKEVQEVHTGWYYLIDERVFFACQGEYPCCHYDMSIEEFLEWNKDIKFSIYG